MSNIFSSIDNSLYTLLDNIAFIDDNILSDTLFLKLLNTSYGITFIANSMLIGFVIYYCIRLSSAFYFGTPIEKPYQFIFKSIVCAICISCYSFLCEQFLNINSLISSCILELGSNIFNINISFNNLIINSNSLMLSSTDNNILSFSGILKSFTSIGLLNLLFSYSIRYILVKVFILIGPFAILSLTNQNSIWFFKSWFRNLFSLLLVQSLISIILLILFSFNLSNNDILTQISYISTIFILTKANNYMRELFGGISTDFNVNLSALRSIIH